MNNYYTLKHLINNIRHIVKNAVFSFAITPRKNVIELYIENSKERYRIITDTGRTNTVFFLDQDRPAKKSNVYNPFESLQNAKIKEIILADRDRYISLMLANNQKLVFTLYGPHANVFLTEKDKIIEAFKSNDTLEGKDVPQPRAASQWNGFDHKDKIKRKITRLNPLFPRKLIPYVIRYYHLKEKTDEEVIEVIKNLSEELDRHPAYRILKTGEICLLSEKSLPVETSKTFDDINSCIRYRYYHGLSKANFEQSRVQLENRFDNILNKMNSQLEELNKSDKSLERADTYEKYGHLLMANIHQKEYDHSDEIQIPNFYDQNKMIDIPLQVDKNLAENAQYYYGKAKKAKKSYEVAQNRLKEISRDKKLLDNLYSEFQSLDRKYELKDWLKKKDKELRKFNLVTDQNHKQVQTPFRKTEIQGYEVWIGKNAKSNDILTSMAHKEDIWLHARGVGGSHVVIRMNNNKDYPQKDIIRKAAAQAAYFSKARGSKMTPVSYTKKKYVRKPKGAVPGTVVLDREEVMMVEPEAGS